MKIIEILTEKPVQSSWITDLLYNRVNKTLTMRLSNGRSFSIPGMTRSMFEKWIKSPSKGRFYHDQIRDRYQITRIR